ncbi:cytochrome c [Mucilaginibacter sp. cycad4]|uniref:cytochrome c n=1 Tax=Mucilaginibacter sp. cycad4 TaxID=3342096 RepID=UPI002AAB062F|nr:cytochrome c [Mucilaginibacter gossypii]WPU97811.1 cytochrome c [Mucilaginibacter gossypii]
MKFKIATILVTAVLLSGCDQTKPKDEGSIKAVSRLTKSNHPGNKIEEFRDAEAAFQQKCAACHGADGTAGIVNAANLQKSNLDLLATIKVITNGKVAMPSFSAQLSAKQIKGISAYVLSLHK